MRTIVHPWVRFLAAIILLMSGVGNLLAFESTVARIGAFGLSSPSFFLVGVIAIEIVAGAFLFWTSKSNPRRAR